MKIFAHRGFSGQYPENTILAFNKVLDFNIYGVEFDVHKTKDNKLVVIHDETIDRTFNSSGYIKDFSLQELQSFNCRFKHFENRDDCKIPTLDQVIEVFLDSNIILNIELKTDEIEYEGIEQDVINTIKKYNISDRVIISSFNQNSLKRCTKIDASIKTGLLYYNPINDVISVAKELKVSSLHPPLHLINRELINNCHKDNLDINVYTVNKLDDMKDLNKISVDGIFTNNIDISSNI